MIIWPMVFRGRAVELRDTQWIAMNMFLDWTRYTNMRPTELSSYTPQTVQGIMGGKLLWCHSVSFLMITDRDIDFNAIMLKVVDRYTAILDISENRALVPEDHALLKELQFEDVQPSQITTSRAPALTGKRDEEAIRNIVKGQNTRALKMGAKGTFTYEEWMLLCEVFEDRCASCGDPHDRLCIDHIVALSRRGSNFIENIQPLCRACNSGKHAKPTDYRGDRAYTFLEALENLRKSS
jgi:hypothetical protein